MTGPRLFRDRAHAGRILGDMMHAYAGHPNGVVLALPRGGVPVGYELARALDLPLDVYVVRKLGVPGHEELAFGALASPDVLVIDGSTVERLDLNERTIHDIAARETVELRRRESAYRRGLAPLDVSGKTVILTDDGLATGATMRAAIAALRRMEPKTIVVAVPVGGPDIVDEFRVTADDIVCAMTPERLQAVGLWYEDFSQTSDDEVRDLLRRAREGARRSA